MNIAYRNENKLHMTKKDMLRFVLVILMKDGSPYIRHYDSAPIYTVVCIVPNTSRIASQYDGAIFEALRQILINDTSQDAQTNAV